MSAEEATEIVQVFLLYHCSTYQLLCDVCQTKEDLKKLRGPAMLIADAGTVSDESECFCLIAGEDGTAEIVDRGQMGAEPEQPVCGTVLFICRPPEEGPANLIFE